MIRQRVYFLLLASLALGVTFLAIRFVVVGPNAASSPRADSVFIRWPELTKLEASVPEPDLYLDPGQLLAEARLGSGRAAALLGREYYEGDLFPSDPEQAEIWLKRAVGREDPLGFYFYGNLVELKRRRDGNQ
ncbi:MAG: hypothetical protein AAF236_17100, partial [Verrucomicrobiota bacterium]